MAGQYGSFVMSVNEVLEAVRAMPPEERAKVRALLEELGTGPRASEEPAGRSPFDAALMSDPRRVNAVAEEIRADDQKESGMQRLREAARSGREADFICAMKSVNWREVSPSDFVSAAGLALEVGAYAAARELSSLGAKLHPEEATLKQYADTLAPPRVVSKRFAPDASIKANSEWLKAHGDHYQGKWIGLRNGVLVGQAESLQNLLKEIGRADDTLVTKVY
jgi:hypothetical protein